MTICRPSRARRWRRRSRAEAERRRDAAVPAAETAALLYRHHQEHVGVVLHHREGFVLQLLKPQLALVQVGLAAVALEEVGEAAQPDEVVLVVEIVELAVDGHATALERPQRLLDEELREAGALAGRDAVLADLEQRRAEDAPKVLRRRDGRSERRREADAAAAVGHGEPGERGVVAERDEADDGLAAQRLNAIPAAVGLGLVDVQCEFHGLDARAAGGMLQ